MKIKRGLQIGAIVAGLTLGAENSIASNNPINSTTDNYYKQTQKILDNNSTGEASYLSELENLEAELNIFKESNAINESFGLAVEKAKEAGVSEEIIQSFIDKYEKCLLEARLERVKTVLIFYKEGNETDEGFGLAILEARKAGVSEEKLTSLIKEYENLKNNTDNNDN